eukprot:jgi/Hompol1/6522/HPOL_003540-RA
MQLLSLVASPKLTHLDLAALPHAVHDSLLGAIPGLCKGLTHISISQSSATDLGILSLLELRYLVSLDMSACLRITNAFAMAFSHPLFVAPIGELILTDCRTLSNDALVTMSKSFLPKYLKRIDLRGCHRITFAVANTSTPSGSLYQLDAAPRQFTDTDLTPLIQFLTSIGRSLEYLAISFAPIARIVEARPKLLKSSTGSSGPLIDISTDPHSENARPPIHHKVLGLFAESLKTLETLVLDDITEDTTNYFVFDLAAQLPRLKHMTLIRSVYTSDHIITSMYADVPSRMHPALINDASVDRFNKILQATGRSIRLVVAPESSPY